MNNLELRPATVGDAVALVRLQDVYDPQFRTAGNAPFEERVARMSRSLAKYGEYVCVADYAGLIVGNATVYPVDLVQAQRMVKGEIPESDLWPKANGAALYVSGINTMPSHRGKQVLLRLMVWLAEQIALSAPVTVFAQPATDEGAALVDRFGFALASSTMDDPIWTTTVASREAALRPVGRRCYRYMEDNLFAA